MVELVQQSDVEGFRLIENPSLERDVDICTLSPISRSHQFEACQVMIYIENCHLS